MNASVAAKPSSGLAIPIVLSILVVLMTTFAMVHVILRESNKNLNVIIDENVLLNAAEAILDKEIAKLKKKPWTEREYKKEGNKTSSGDERGIFINDAGYEGLEYYFFIEDVKYCDYFVGKACMSKIFQKSKKGNRNVGRMFPNCG